MIELLHIAIPNREDYSLKVLFYIAQCSVIE